MNLQRSLVEVLIFAGLACSWTPASGQTQEALPSWRDTKTRTAILKFVEDVCDKDSDNYVASADRIATLDNDGTLWCEKPLYIHLFANLDRFKELVKAKPELESQQPYQAILNKDVSYFMDLLEQGKMDEIVSDVFGEPFKGLTTEEYAKWNRDWLAKWKHPRFDRGYRDLTYQPMVELVQLLRSKEFDVHIFTADEGAFLKLIASEIYDLPLRNIHGSSIKLTYEADGGKPRLVRTASARYLNNWDAKPRLIFEDIGKKPIFAAGNSNGDLHMLQYVSQQSGPAMSVLVHHTDAEREFAYDSHTDKVMPMAKNLGWTVVDMKADWERVFRNPR